jgi:hypothetical protein
MYQINTLYWKNTDPIFPEYHKKIMNKFNIKVNYVNESLHHGKWMDSIMNKSKAEIIGFIDIDCVVTNAEIIHKCIKYVKNSKSIIGIAQASNHIHPCTHIFAGAGFFFINKDSWIQNGKPSFCMLKPKLKNFFKKKYDVAEGVCYQFEENNFKYKTLFPTHYDLPLPKKWYLHTYGEYGIGTYYKGGVYHLYESRISAHTKIFQEKCLMILNDNFSTKNMLDCCDF